MSNSKPGYVVLDEINYNRLVRHLGAERMLCGHDKCHKPVQPGETLYRKMRGKSRLSVYYHEECWDELNL